ncbi:hypothetical protein GCM10025778_05810 [Paeniglutamicibacter antarcticus]|uniref:Uncharacterized protein n=1 Tax=Paeniglutamicibacter antarcticus TaxID=494023 RepID=A0ABP9TIR9_9MICC
MASQCVDAVIPNVPCSVGLVVKQIGGVYVIRALSGGVRRVEVLVHGVVEQVESKADAAIAMPGKIAALGARSMHISASESMMPRLGVSS